MTTAHGTFIWYDLHTTDAAAALTFYKAVIGWQTHLADVPGEYYHVLTTGGAGVGGIVDLPAQAVSAGFRPGWLGYVAVDDVDAMALRVAEAGGAVRKPPTDIPGIGRFAVVADPQGAVFILFRPHQPGAPPPQGAVAGRIGWHELYAADLEGALAFYEALFGWTRAEAIDMGPMGPYQLFATGAHPVGGMMKRPDPSRPPGWMFYINVADVDDAIRRIAEAGGQVVHGPVVVPGGSRIAQCVDPQGAGFAVVQPPG